MIRKTILIYILLFGMLFPGCTGENSFTLSSVSYSGDIRATAINSPFAVPEDFQITNKQMTKTLDSIFSIPGEPVSRATRIFPIWEMNLYSVSNTQDTICFSLLFDKNNVAYVEHYTHCYEGVLLDNYSSSLIYHFFEDYFKITKPNHNF